MNGDAAGTTALLVGILAIRLVLSDAFRRYVQPGMAPWLLAAGAALVLLGAVTLVRALRGRPEAHGDHDHDHGDRAGWLLLVPVLAVLLAPPPALGSYGVDRVVTVATAGRTFPALPDDGVPRPMTLAEFGQRAADAAGASFAGRPVELTGFVAGGDGFRLARYQISCCAADAVAAVVAVRGAAAEAPRDAWVTVVGTFGGVGPDGTPELDAVASQQVAAPVDPYE